MPVRSSESGGAAAATASQEVQSRPEVQGPHAPHDAARSARRRWERGLFWGFAATAFLLGCYEVTDGDFFWHLKTGELIWRRGEIPAHDWYTYTNPESRWIDLHWGFQLGVYAVWSLAGPAGVVLVKSAVGAAVFALLWVAAQPPASADAAPPGRLPPALVTVLLLPPLLLFAGRYFERPEMLSLFFLTVFLYVISRAERRPGLLWLLPAVQLAWVNVQGLFILGPLTMALWLVGRAAERLTPSLASLRSRTGPDLSLETRSVRRRRERRGAAAEPAAAAPEALAPSAGSPFDAPSWETLRRAAWVFLAVLAACLANPYGVEGALFPFVLQARIQGPEREFFLNLAGEFSGPWEFVAQFGPAALLRNMTTLMLIVVFLFGTASIVAALRVGRRPWFETLLFAAFLYLAVQAGRNSNLFAVAGGWVVVWNFSSAAAARRFRDGEDASPEGEAAAGSTTRLRLLAAALLAGIALSAPTGVLAEARGAGPKSMVPRRFGFGLAEWYPFEAVKLLGREGMPTRVYATHLGVASVYIHQLGPERRVFADPRLEANAKRVLAAFLEYQQRLSAGDPTAEKLLRETLPPGEPPLPAAETPALLVDFLTLAMDEPLRFALARHPHWRMVHLDASAAVFLWDDRAQRLGLKTLPLQP